MEEACAGARAMLTAFAAEATVESCLTTFVKSLEAAYAAAQDITLFVFALRSFFRWHRSPEFLRDSEAVTRVREAWVRQNEEAYTSWLASVNDDPEALKWEKWTFQAKMSILKEEVEQAAR